MLSFWCWAHILHVYVCHLRARAPLVALKLSQHRCPLIHSSPFVINTISRAPGCMQTLIHLKHNSYSRYFGAILRRHTARNQDESDPQKKIRYLGIPFASEGPTLHSQGFITSVLVDEQSPSITSCPKGTCPPKVNCDTLLMSMASLPSDL